VASGVIVVGMLLKLLFVSSFGLEVGSKASGSKNSILISINQQYWTQVQNIPTTTTTLPILCSYESC
jgi:hypothetical protein